MVIGCSKLSDNFALHFMQNTFSVYTFRNVITLLKAPNDIQQSFAFGTVFLNPVCYYLFFSSSLDVYLIGTDRITGEFSLCAQ